MEDEDAYLAVLKRLVSMGARDGGDSVASCINKCIGGSTPDDTYSLVVHGSLRLPVFWSRAAFVAPSPPLQKFSARLLTTRPCHRLAPPSATASSSCITTTFSTAQKQRCRIALYLHNPNPRITAVFAQTVFRGMSHLPPRAQRLALHGTRAAA